MRIQAEVCSPVCTDPSGCLIGTCTGEYFGDIPAEAQSSKMTKGVMMSGMPFVVGAYASMPPDAQEQEGYYRLLGEQNWISGAELPFPGSLADPAMLKRLSYMLPDHWAHNTVTAIPGTMKRVWADPAVGLASRDADGRAAALEFIRSIRDAVDRLAQLKGENTVSYIELHSAPTAGACADSMRASLEEVLRWQWNGSRLAIEHCDRYIEGQKPEKGFLPVEDEIAAAKELGIGIIINWGRSAVEGRDAVAPYSHIAQAGDSGVLAGVMFSGACPAETQYGYSWIDGHLPMAPDEPASLMDAERIRRCADRARKAGTVKYLGAKVCVPSGSSLPERLSFLRHIYEAACGADTGGEGSDEAGAGGYAGTGSNTGAGLGATGASFAAPAIAAIVLAAAACAASLVCSVWRRRGAAGS